MMRFAEEMVDAPEMPDVERVKVPARELKLASDLIGAFAGEWKPEQHTDDYQQNLQAVIKSKLKGETVVLEGDERPVRAEVVDLAERLEASLRAAGGGGGRKTTAPKRAIKTRSRAGGTKSKRKRAA